MTQTTHTDNVLIDGSRDITQLQVEGHSTQNEPLQTWQANGATAVARVAKDGRLQTGTLGLGTPDALVEANLDNTTQPTLPKRGVQSLGKLTGALASAIDWAIHELELLGTGGVSALITALRAKVTHKNSGSSGSAELRAGDFQALNQTGTVGTPVGKATGVRGTASNTPLVSSTAYLAKAIGVEATVTNDASGTVTEASAFEVAPPTNGGTITTLYGMKVPDLTQGQTNYALHTGQGVNRLGDQLNVVGSGNKVQSIVKANTTQTANLQEWQTSGGSPLSVIGSGGELGVGATSPAAKVHVQATSEQLRLGYDATKVSKFTTDTNGQLNLDIQGAKLNLKTSQGDSYVVLYEDSDIGTHNVALGTSHYQARFISTLPFQIIPSNQWNNWMEIDSVSGYIRVTFANPTGPAKFVGPAGGELIFDTAVYNQPTVFTPGTAGIGIGGTPPASTKFYLTTGAAGTKGAVIRLAASPTANALEVQDSTGTVLSSLDKSGALALGQAGAPNSVLQVNGPIATALATKTANYTLTATDSIILANAASGAVALTLPTAVGCAGRVYTLKKIDSSANAVTVATSASQTIDGASSQALAAQWNLVRVASDGSNWFIV
jgi:hypothetical protein